MFTDTGPGQRFRSITARAGQALQADDELTSAGPYRLLNVIGHGGMGTVYAAERADGAFDRRVAIKVLRGLPSPDALARLRRERQILARMDHPNIARLLDGGETARGQPYLVLELVDGQTIDRHADSGRFGLRQRLWLFLDVCEAIAAAHRQLIVHCDIKPANVLIDATGRVRVLDFGIANLLDPASAVAGAPDARHVTRDYASPEQLTGEPVGTASDIYSLGLLLGELLGGRATSVERRSVPPSRWSSLTTAAAARGLSPRALRRQLAGDLDAIVGRATSVDIAGRYADVQGLIDDIKRHLRQRPVQARRGGVWYRTTRFCLRHRRRIIAGVLVGASLATLGTRYLVERRSTAMQAQVVRGVAATLRDVFVAGAMTASGDRPVREMVRDRAANVAAADHIEPLVKARLYYLFSLALANLGEMDDADRMVVDSVRLRASVLGRFDTEGARVHAAAVQLALDRGDVARAISRMQTLAELDGSIYPLDDIDALELHSLQGQIAAQGNDLAGALRLLDLAYADAVRLYGVDNLHVAPHASHYARVLARAGQQARARAVAAVAWNLYQQAFGPDAVQLQAFKRLNLAPAGTPGVEAPVPP
jgi:serine/threonine-protein kinase